jgi:hypothetical protein
MSFFGLYLLLPAKKNPSTLLSHKIFDRKLQQNTAQNHSAVYRHFGKKLLCQRRGGVRKFLHLSCSFKTFFYVAGVQK